MAVIEVPTGDDEAFDALVAEAAERLAAGEVLVLPTDTVYGLAAALARPEAVARLAELKGRPADLPIAVLVADAGQAASLAHLTPLAGRLAARHWPGPLTLVLDARPGVAEVVGSAQGTVGVRCPDHRLVVALAERVGPLAATSANVHGAATPTTAAGVAAAFPDVATVLDGGPASGTASTVADARGEAPLVLRAGPLALDETVL